MSINETIDLIKKLLGRTTKRREIRIYKKFIGILSGLNKMDLTREVQQQIEAYLTGLQLNDHPAGSRKYFPTQYAAFTDYLKTKFSFITEGYYSAIGLSLGLSLGAGLGVSFGSIGGGTGISIGISMGAGIGMLVGMLVGATKDAEAKKNGKVIDTKID